MRKYLARAICPLLACLALTTPSVHSPLAHMAAVTLDNFQRREQKIWVGILENHQVPTKKFAAFELGNGRSLVVTSPLRPGGRSGHIVTWPPGTLLVFVEGNTHGIGKRLAGDASKGLYFVTTQEYQTLARKGGDDARQFAMPIEAAEQTSLEISSLNSLRPQTTNASTFAFDQANAVRVSIGRLMQTIREFSGVDPVVVDGQSLRISERGTSQKRQLAQKHLANRFRAMGLESQNQCYKARWHEGCNVEATLWGESREKVILLTAHLDSMTNPGADDNGSGVAALLEIAHLLKDQDLEYSLRFVAFDQEELGIIGSKEYVRNLQPAALQSITAAFNMDMIGYDSNGDGKIHIIDCGRRESTPLTQSFETVSQKLGTGLKRSEACTNRSDHASFWSKGIPSILVSENFFGNDGNRCYHRACDTLELINQEYMGKIVTVLANTVLGLAQRD